MNKSKKIKNKLQPNDDDNRCVAILKRNCLSIFFASIICLLTIIFVPLVYSIKPTIKQVNETSFSWNSTGTTAVNQSLGVVSSIKFYSSELYILDKTNHRLIKYNFNQNALSIVLGNANGSSGNDTFTFNSPNEFLIVSLEQIYIVDQLNNRIQLCSSDRNPCETIISDGLYKPASIALDTSSNLFIANYGKDQIVRFNLISKEKLEFLSFDPMKQRNEYVLTPISIQYDGTSNSLVIAQETGFNVIRWKINSTSWTLIAGSVSSDLSGTSRTLFNKLCYVNIDEFGNTYVVDCENQRIQGYNGDGTKGRTIAGVIQAEGNNSFLFKRPTSITFDSSRNLYVSDSLNYRIQKFLRV